MDGYTLGLYEKSMPGSLSLPEKLAAAREAGYDCLEISIDETDEKLARLDWGEEERLRLVESAARAGCPVATMCLSAHRRYPLGSEDPETAGRGMEIFEGAVLLAEAVGVRLIQLAGYDEYYRESNARTRENFLRNLRRAVHFAAAHKVQLGFETMETPFMDTCEKAMRYVAQIGSPYLSVYPDIGNMTNAAKLYRTDVLDDLASAGGHIAAMHLKETRPGVYREVPYGTGHVDFPGAVRRALDLGVRAFTAEFWYTGEPDWKARLLENNRFLRRQFERCGDC
ncbi:MULTISPECIES: L-ribulose-5-phosphate 3-epimerase [Anaerotruncus]|uniref:L-ribulose-5-phosphate 3-epimerase n=2 Tax=Anaerotruncus TaxID=244127 RepID=A0A498CRC2_9FIRM|nr:MULTISPECIES: L-ribulose-5-phosphate 3-epimerase [Anaerotruncus]MBC3937618.1 L-ribulose-5-phosphate 3-epimerase [Anaerotruncus massiliensis (ex Togo et al. 2019)]MCQ4894290.1 L-ribulose-5-phosphate 3-epimerase [Anaerotruncus sp. DFI.9.16]RLL14726.1 L-ribulose-5-phosphate 3-epimerase [Anaerotruncus massiliensis (ex Liu et al. 2021)]GKH46756.1 L-ribulose-5-phosphate 3-epimerase [Oscillospiraceae bacterium]